MKIFFFQMILFHYFSCLFTIFQRQVALLKQHLIQADQLNKEQAITIESLKRRLNHNNSNGTKINGNSNNSSHSK